jgi:hypothetical protein
MASPAMIEITTALATAALSWRSRRQISRQLAASLDRPDRPGPAAP